MQRLFIAATTIISACAFWCGAGPNADALVAVDLDHTTERIDSFGVIGGTTIKAGVRIVGARNLDAYQFVVRYNPAVCSLISVSRDDAENGLVNFLESLGGEALGFVRRFSSHVNISYTLTGNQDESQAPDGDGLLAVLRFKVLAVYPCTLSIDSVRLIDFELERDTSVRTSPGYLQTGTLCREQVYSPRRAFGSMRTGTAERRRFFDGRGRILRKVAPGSATGHRMIQEHLGTGRIFPGD